MNPWCCSMSPRHQKWGCMDACSTPLQAALPTKKTFFDRSRRTARGLSASLIGATGRSPLVRKRNLALNYRFYSAVGGSQANLLAVSHADVARKRGARWRDDTLPPPSGSRSMPANSGLRCRCERPAPAFVEAVSRSRRASWFNGPGAALIGSDAGDGAGCRRPTRRSDPARAFGRRR